MDPRDFGPTNNDERHHISLSGIVQLPLGFQVAPIVSYGSARPYDLRSGFDVLARGSGYSRPVIVPNSDPTNYTAISTMSLHSTAWPPELAIRPVMTPFEAIRSSRWICGSPRTSGYVRVGTSSSSSRRLT